MSDDTFTIEHERIQNMDMRERCDLCGVLRTIGDLLTAFNCQPRFGSGVASEVIEDLAEFLYKYENAILEIVKSSKPIDVEEARQKGRAIIAYEASLGGTDRRSELFHARRHEPYRATRGAGKMAPLGCDRESG
jgi:hypothetical protein